MPKKPSSTLLRMNVLFLSVFFLFSLLILRLGFVQIVFGQKFQRELARHNDITIHHPVPRGKIFDRNFKIIVDNTPGSAITFINTGISRDKMLKTAEKLAELIKQKTDAQSEHDKKEFWILKNPLLADAKISNQERRLYQEKILSDQDIHQLKLARISQDEIRQLSHHDLETLAIYRDFLTADHSSPIIVKKSDVSSYELAAVSENLQSLPGVDTSTDWERSYIYHKTLQSVLGSVTKSNEGLPADKLNVLLTKGYSRNDRVGKSYLELQYDDVLCGHKEKVKVGTDKDGNVLERKLIAKGQQGMDLILSIDMSLQIAVEKIIEEELVAAKKLPGTRLLDRAYVVLLDPRTGELLAMAGKRIEKNPLTGRQEMKDDALGTFTTTYNVGSSVKGATILTGFQTGAINPGTIFDDKGLKIKGTPLKKSYAYLGKLNDLNALKKSSNVYMFHTAIKLAKGHYEYNQPLRLQNPYAIDKIRNAFASYGLGTRTGIDLPNEQIGFKGSSRLPGFMLDLVIGQYDTYSTMQLAQYMATIANGGLRMKPFLVKEIRGPLEGAGGLGPIVKESVPTVLNSIEIKKQWMNRVHLGFKKVMQEPGGTAYKFFETASYSPAGKTGTAEAFYDGPMRKRFGKEPPAVINLSLVGYAPSEKPEMAMAVLVPWAYQGEKDHKANLKIGRRVMDAYFKLNQ